jgi:predicted MPP superfamily phosphohydrolase
MMGPYKGIIENIFSFFYIIFGLHFGYLLYIFLTSIIIRIIDACVDIPVNVGIPILYGLPGLICIYGVINALITKVVKINLKFPGYKDRTTILHLTDIHLGAIHKKYSIEKIVHETQELNPDIVVITGDMADGSLKVKTEWLQPFDQLEIPILYVTGNHEEMNPTKDMLKAVNQTKIKHIGHHGRYKYKDINFIGEDFGYNLKECLDDIKQENGIPNILLSHIPTMKPEE